MKVQKREAIFWHLSLDHILKLSKISGWKPFPKASQNLLHFLIVLKTLASKKLPLLLCHTGKTGVHFHRTWQHLSWSLLFNCTLPWGFRIRCTSSFMALSDGEAFEQFSSSVLCSSQTTEALQLSEAEITFTGMSC